MKSKNKLPDKLIELSITIDGLFHVGGREYSAVDVDLPILKQHDITQKRLIPIIPPSSFKGLLRASAERAALHLFGPNNTSSILHLFGTSNTDTSGSLTTPGLIQIYSSTEHTTPITDDMILTRMSNRIDEMYGSVSHQALWQYELVMSKDPIQIGYEIHFLYPVDENDAVVLLAGLNLLRYSSIGGLRSRGMGLITEINIITKSFVNRVKSILEGMVK